MLNISAEGTVNLYTQVIILSLESAPKNPTYQCITQEGFTFICEEVVKRNIFFCAAGMYLKDTEK